MPVYREDFGRTDAMLRGAMKCDKAGETITVKWNGTTIGFSDIPQGSGMEVEVTIDQSQTPITIKRPQTESIDAMPASSICPNNPPASTPPFCG